MLLANRNWKIINGFLKKTLVWERFIKNTKKIQPTIFSMILNFKVILKNIYKIIVVNFIVFKSFKCQLTETEKQLTVF